MMASVAIAYAYQHSGDNKNIIANRFLDDETDRFLHAM